PSVVVQPAQISDISTSRVSSAERMALVFMLRIVPTPGTVHPYRYQEMRMFEAATASCGADRRTLLWVFPHFRTSGRSCWLIRGLPCVLQRSESPRFTSWNVQNMTLRVTSVMVLRRSHIPLHCVVVLRC